MTARKTNRHVSAQPDPTGAEVSSRLQTGSALLTVRQAAEFLGCSATNVYGLIDAGELPVITVGRSRGYRLSLSDLEDFVHQRRTRKEGKKPSVPVSRPRLKHIKL